MKHNSSTSVTNLPPLRRFMLTLQLDPAKATIFYCIMGVVLFVALVGGAYALVSRGQALQAADIGTAPLQTGTAVVVGRTPWSVGGGKMPNNSGLLLNVSIDGRQSTTPQNIDERTFRMKVGDKIRVNFRIGKSGAIYIEDWQPLPH
jgi:hypothetical protein